MPAMSHQDLYTIFFDLCEVDPEGNAGLRDFVKEMEKGGKVTKPESTKNTREGTFLISRKWCPKF